MKRREERLNRAEKTLPEIYKRFDELKAKYDI